MSTAAQIEITDESQLIEAWRFEALERAGYLLADAAELATRLDIDLHRAVELIQQGCPYETAIEILI